VKEYFLDDLQKAQRVLWHATKIVPGSVKKEEIKRVPKRDRDKRRGSDIERYHSCEQKNNTCLS
jgi:hypothetical protein